MPRFGFLWHTTRYLLAAVGGAFIGLLVVVVALAEGWVAL